MPPSSSRNSAYSLKTLSRPSSTIQRPSSLADRPLLQQASIAPPRRQPTASATEDRTDPSRDAFLPQEVDRYDRIWGDMAARMGELDTLANPTNELALVTEAHAKAVERLRENQILLAETWAGSEERLGSRQSSLLAKLANSAAGIEEAEITNEERARMNDTVFQQMEHEVGIVMQQLEEVIIAQAEVEKVCRDMWKTTLSIGQEKNKEGEGTAEEMTKRETVA